MACLEKVDALPHQEQEHIQVFDFQKLNENLGKVKKFQGNGCPKKKTAYKKNNIQKNNIQKKQHTKKQHTKKTTHKKSNTQKKKTYKKQH